MRTDRRTDMTKLIVSFLNFANAPKNQPYLQQLKFFIKFCCTSAQPRLGFHEIIISKIYYILRALSTSTIYVLLILKRYVINSQEHTNILHNHVYLVLDSFFVFL